VKALPVLALCLAAACVRPVTPPSTVQAVSQPLPPAGFQETVITSEGLAAVAFEGGTATARDEALDDALRKAVEQGVGAYVDAESVVENFQLISDRIYYRTSGYVSSYSVIFEEEQGDLYRVVIRAVVKTGEIEDDLAAIGILLAQQGRPRLMVLVEELEEHSGEPSCSGAMFETMLMEHFSELGFPVVDAATVAGIIRQDQERLILDGDDETASLLGLEAGAEIVVAGTATLSEESRLIAGSARTVYDFQVSCRAINTRTAQVLAASATSTELPFSESQARSSAADTTAAELAEAILSGWTGHENVTVIVVYNADFDKLQELRSQILLRVRGVVDVVTRDLTGSRATLEVFSETGTQEVIDDLSSEEMGLDFQITGMAGNRVEIHFGD
jgi:hypothetical protein